MKKIVKGILVLLFVVFASVSVNAGQEKIGSFYIGPFVLNQANWTQAMDGQLFRAMENIPDEAKLEVYGHTDNSGSMAVNEKLADERAELVAEKINKIRPDINISAVTGMVYQAGANEVDYRSVRIDVYVPDEWLSTNEELAAQLKTGLADLKDELTRQRQSIKDELEAVSNMGKTVEKLSDLHKITLCAVLGVFTLLLVAYFMIRRNQKKDTTEIVSTIKNTVVEVRKVDVEHEEKIYTVRAEKKSGLWYSPFRLENGNDIYRSEWDDIKKSIKGSIKSTNENFRMQKEKLIALEIIKVKETE